MKGNGFELPRSGLSFQAAIDGALLKKLRGKGKKTC